MSDTATVPAGHELKLSAHPRAQRQIRRAKAWGGLVGLLLTFFVAHRAGLAFDAALERALPAAIVGYVLTWIVALATWRHLAAAELEVARKKILARVREMQAEAEADRP